MSSITYSGKLAYSVSRKRGVTTYLARVCIMQHDSIGDLEIFCATGIGDTREEAETDARRYTREYAHREGFDLPDLADIGKVSAFFFDRKNFI